jgi:hypothetical protein
MTYFRGNFMYIVGVGAGGGGGGGGGSLII